MMKLLSILTILVLLSLSISTFNGSAEQEQLLIYKDIFNSRVAFFNGASIYVHEEIRSKNTELAETYYNRHNSISTEFGPKSTLSNKSFLEQSDFHEKKIIITSDLKIEQIKDTSHIAIAEIWVGEPIFNKSLDQAIVMEEWSCGGWAAEGRLFIYEKINGKWKVKRTILKWM